ncbi:major facilitator superfamily domain-containing protein [Trichoderma chlorosporum]
MSALIRDTALGTTVRFILGNSMLAYPNSLNAHCPANRKEAEQTSVENRDFHEYIEVGWASSDDPDNPQNWSLQWKIFVSSLICVYTFTVYCGSSIYVPSEEQVMKEFNVSETVASLGLALYVLRCFFGSPCLATGAASLSDMFPVTRIPYPLAAWSGAMYAGPALGPLLSGFAVTAKTWRWAMREMVWLTAIVLVALFILLPETAAPTLLYYKAMRLRKETGDSKYVSECPASQQLSRIQVIRLALVKPFEITVKDPAIAFVNLYTALTYGIYYSFFEVFPLVYAKIYGMNLGETSAVFLCVLIGCIIGTMWYCTWYRCFAQKRFDKLGTFDVQETFLRPGLVGVFGAPIGMFLFGWAARESVPWEVPTLGIIIYCGCSFVVGLGIFIHLPCSYTQYSASLFAANDAFRSAFASAAILFGRPLYSNLGVGCSLLGGLSAFGIIGFWYLFLYGDKLRKRSKFTANQ